jgi:hypothetical protein
MTQFTYKGVKQINNRISFNTFTKSSTIKSWPTFCDQYFWKFPIWNSRVDEKRREIRMVKVLNDIRLLICLLNPRWIHCTFHRKKKFSSASKVVRLLFAQRFITIFNCRYHTSNHLSVCHKPTSLSPINCQSVDNCCIIINTLINLFKWYPVIDLFDTFTSKLGHGD